MDFDEQIKDVQSVFRKNVIFVIDLMNFDNAVLEYAITTVKIANEKIKKSGRDNPLFLLDKTIHQLETISENDSLKSKYNMILNQCVVLLVSYFGTAIEEIFKTALNYRIKKCSIEQICKDEIKISLGELAEIEYNLSDSIVDILISQKKDISFQDMQSISRAFNEYFRFTLPKNTNVNNIIMAQACRHAIVHSGCIVSSRTLKQITGAKPREIKDNLKVKDMIQFSKTEINIIGESMKSYIDIIITKLHEWEKYTQT